MKDLLTGREIKSNIADEIELADDLSRGLQVISEYNRLKKKNKLRKTNNEEEMVFKYYKERVTVYKND